MSFLFTCPFCQTRTEVPDEFAGQSGPCAVCGRTIVIPRDPASAAAPESSKTSASMVFIMLLIAGGALFAIAFVGLLVGFLFPAFNSAQVASRKVQCDANLKAIALAMHQYHDQYGCFPPAFVADGDGKPLHSWRVLLLPQLGYSGLYNQYDLNSPFDSDTNIQLAGRMPPEYACPSDPDATILAEPNYMVVVGDRTMFPGDKSTSFAQLRDGSSQTIMLVEVCQSGVNWMEPVDLKYDKMLLEINADEAAEISSHHENGAHIATADGMPHFLTNQTPPHYVSAMLSISGGESVPSAVLDQ